MLTAIPWWKRQYTCVIAAALGGLAAWVIPYVLTSGFEKVAAVGEIGVPTVTLVMFADHFVLPRNVRRVTAPGPGAHVAPGRPINWLAVVAVIIATDSAAGQPACCRSRRRTWNWASSRSKRGCREALPISAAVAVVSRVATPAALQASLGFSDLAIESSQRYPGGDHRCRVHRRQPGQAGRGHRGEHSPPGSDGDDEGFAEVGPQGRPEARADHSVGAFAGRGP